MPTTAGVVNDPNGASVVFDGLAKWLNYGNRKAESYAQNQLLPRLDGIPTTMESPAGGGRAIPADAQAVRRHEMAPKDYAALYGTTFHGGEAAALAMAMSTRGANIDQIAYWLE